MKNLAVDVLLTQIASHQRAGRTAEVLAACRQAMALKPDDAGVCNQIGMVLSDYGEFDEAAKMYGRALELRPGAAAAAYNLGNALRSAGRSNEALGAYQRAIDLQPDLVPALINLSALLQGLGRQDDAEAVLHRLLVVCPGEISAHNNLGLILQNKGLQKEARAEFETARKQAPDHPGAYINLSNLLRSIGEAEQALDCARQAFALSGRPEHQTYRSDAAHHVAVALLDCGRIEEALATCRDAMADGEATPTIHFTLACALRSAGMIEDAMRATRELMALRPHDAGPVHLMAELLQESGQVDEAIAALRRALELSPKEVRIWDNLCVLLREAGRWDEAIAAGEHAVGLDGTHAEAWCNLSVTLAGADQLPRAIDAARRAVELAAEKPVYRWNLSTFLLKAGQLAEGFRLAEARWGAPEIHTKQRPFKQPQWDGSDLGSRRLLIYAEQGIGDVLQFVRYLPLMSTRGGQVILECAAPLRRLLEANLDRVAFVDAGESLPDFDIHCSLMSLPMIFNTTLQTIPANVPYLQADPALTARWQARVAAVEKAQLKIAIVWAGNPVHKNDHRRSIDPSLLKPLTQVPGVRLFSLQAVGQRGFAANAHAVATEMGVINWTAELRDFADTAALLANLDLLICVDTAVAHLAGAMGRPVWTLIPFNGDWRWFSGREDSPWYPTMRLFRQEVPGDWGVPIARITELLRTAAQGGSL